MHSVMSAIINNDNNSIKFTPNYKSNQEFPKLWVTLPETSKEILNQLNTFFLYRNMLILLWCLLVFFTFVASQIANFILNHYRHLHLETGPCYLCIISGLKYLS